MMHAFDKEDFLANYRKRTLHRVIGLMSGTSLDGVDAVLVAITNDDAGAVSAVSLEHQVSIPYSKEMQQRMGRLCVPGKSDVNDLTVAHFGLAHWYASAVNQLIAECGRGREQIDAVCMHGQTVWHAPVAQDFPGPRGGHLAVTGTLQLGNASVLASLTGLPVISDFRSADMAEGGEGAPLAPYIDYLLYAKQGEGRAVQNIGGIGNVTVLPLGGTRDSIFAFDTGPGNMIMDAVVSIGTKGDKTFDDSGSIAAAGTVSSGILETLMADPYFARKPPKSTGREVYGQAFAARLMELAKGLAFEDIVATATAFTALSIAQAYKDFVLPATPLHTVVVSGGGALNNTLLAMLREYLPQGIVVTTSNSLGVPDQAREAMAFALMGHESLMGRPSNIPAVTGARKAMVLGLITMQQI
jgi:anhydro-N-acetylmuramic acid kinase